MPMASRVSAAAAADLALLDLCARIAKEPARIIEPSCVAIGRGIGIPEHRHPDWLQLDLAIGCGGRWTIAGAPVTAGATTALVFYPGVDHGYELTPMRSDGVVFNFKLRVGAQWPAVRAGIFPVVSRGLAGEDPLARALRRMARLGAVAGSTSPLLVATVIEALCLWPRGGSGRDASITDAAGDADADGRVHEAMAIIDERLDQPPSVPELARRVRLSSRHLSRRFEALCGCSPHAYITARRLARARELLAQGRMNVTQAAEALGFPSIHTFSRWFRRESGQTPAAFRAHPSGF